MNDLLQSLVYDDFGYRKEGNNWGRAETHSSLVVNEQEQKWYWNSENMGGGVLEYLLLVRKMEKSKAQEFMKRLSLFAKDIQDSRPDEEYKPYDKLIELLWSLGKGNRDYWYSRKLTDETIDRYRLGFYNGWNLIPLYDGGKFVNFQCRRDLPRKAIRYWYKSENVKPVLMNSDILPLVSSIVITEGTVDSILLNQMGIASVAQTGGAGFWDSAWYSMFGKINSITYIADNDSAGRFAAKKVATHLGVDRTKIFMYSGRAEKYDTVDFFRDKGTVEQLRELLETQSKNVFEIEELNKGGSKGYVKRYKRKH